MKITGIKKAIGEFNNTIGNVELFFNKVTGEIWTVFNIGQDWTEYKSENIVKLLQKGNYTMASGWDKISMAEVKEMIEMLEV
jgi:hypothetical protein